MERDSTGKFIGRKQNVYGLKTETKSATSKVFLDPDQCRVGLLDIETTGLKGDFDIVLCGVIKTFRSRELSKVFQIDLCESDLLKSEKQLLLDINNELSKYDGIITFYGSRFDVPMIRTRSLYHGIDPLPKLKHLDMYFTIKRTINTTSRRMDRVNELLRISNPELSPKKTRLEIADWMAAMFSRDPTALDYIVDHCLKDVEILENIVEQFEKFVPDRILRQ